MFNRSYYEDVRVRPEVLERQKLPAEALGPDLWRRRFEDIVAFERYLSGNGTAILKFFLHVSREEQRRRFLDRLEEPHKRWKFSLQDVHERARWDDYQRAYEDALSSTSTAFAPWYVVPADNKWFTRMAVADAVVDCLESLKLKRPEPSPAQIDELEQARTLLEAEREKSGRRARR